MFFATTSEDFIRSSTNFAPDDNDENHQRQRNNTRLQMLIFNGNKTSSSDDESENVSACKRFLFERAHLIGNVGWIVIPNDISHNDSNQQQQQQRLSLETIQNALQNSVKRYETITEKKSKLPCFADNKNNNSTDSTRLISIVHNHHEDAGMILTIIDEIENRENNNNNCCRVLLFENLAETQLVNDLKDIFQMHLSKLPRLQRQLQVAARPSHGFWLESENSSSSFCFVPYCVIEPAMHRRIPLLSSSSSSSSAEFNVKRFHRAINLDQVVMESLQKSGLLGKYGA